MLSDLEFRRGIFHLLSGIAIVLLIKFDFLTKWLLLLLCVVALGISLASKKHRIPIIYWFLERFDRERDIQKFPGKGAFFYLLGVTLVVFLFPKDIAMASIAILAIADPFSRFIGIRFGKIRHPFNDAKFTEGAVAGIITGFLAAILFVRPSEAFFAAFFAMVAEGVELKLGMQHVDDNIVIPLVAGAIIWLVRILSTL